MLVAKICKQCNEEFQTKYKSSKFCSRECGYENKRRQVEFECLSCGKPSKQRRSDYNKHKRHFCSRDCSNKWRSENVRGKNHHQTGVKFSDAHRNKISEKVKAYWARSENKWKRQGANNPAWNGGVTPQNHLDRTCNKYYEWQKAVYEKDRYTCVRCLDNRGGNLNAHHIIPFCIAHEERFEVNNGATLCKECHEYIHEIELGGNANLRNGA